MYDDGAMPIRAVLFDLGDTLIFQAHEPDGDRLLSAALRQQSLMPHEDDNAGRY